MGNQRLHALIDTNVWISAFISRQGAPARVLRAYITGQFQLIISQPLLDEFHDVLSRPRIQRRLQTVTTEVITFLQYVDIHATVVIPANTLHICRDPKDDIVLETAILGEAQFVVSRDDDIKRDLNLIAHVRANGVEVVSVAQFLARLDEP
jgi:putative PIN family toxin of toxin-antitoxin system